MPIKATMLLADSAQAVEGKLYILGGGWNMIGPGPSPLAVALHIEVSWDRSNIAHPWRLELVDSDGQPVTVATPMGEKEPVAVGGNFEVGRPPGVPIGTNLGVSIAINFGPLPLAPGERYEWRLTVAGESDEDWRLPFSSRPMPPEAGEQPAG